MANSIFDADKYAEQTFKAVNALFDYPTAGGCPDGRHNN